MGKGMTWPARLLVATLSAGIFNSGCALARSKPAVMVLTREDTVSFQRDPRVTLFRVTGVVHNLDSRVLYLVGCGPSAQRQISGEWVTLYAPLCFLTEHTVRVAPGDSAVVPFTGPGYTDESTYPRLDPRMVSGLYRLVFNAVVGEPTYDVTPPASQLYKLPSRPFQVKD
jgi:hypothetical protein